MARSITLKGFKEYESRLKNGGKQLRQLADLEASASAQNIARGARTKARVNDGTLRASINPDKVKIGVYEVKASADYAAYIEFGTKSKVKVPADLQNYAKQFQGKGTGTAEQAKAFIYEWCRKKNIPEERWFFIYILIMTNGIEARPFLFPSVEEERPKFFERIRQALADL